ncbi:hypothetical protein ScPMuIL_010424 [Solemya velum]
MACSYLQMNDNDMALKHLSNALRKDNILVIAYYQRGLVNFNLGKIGDAVQDFETCMTWMRGNVVIDYKQLGLLLKLYACEILYHQAVVYEHEGKTQTAKQKLELASEKEVEPKHKTIMKRAQHLMETGQFAEIKPLPPPISCVFTPPKALTQNMAKRDYIGKAEVVSSYEPGDQSVGFDGPRNVEERRAKTPSPTSDMTRKGDTLTLPLSPTRASRSMENISTTGNARSSTLPTNIDQAFRAQLNIATAFLMSKNSPADSNSENSITNSSITSNSQDSNCKLSPIPSTGPRRPPPSYPPPPLPTIVTPK